MVNATKLRRAQARTDLVLPGTVQAWQDTAIYARITGYVKKWNKDIGDPVKMGQTLAVIDAPDIDQQLNQAVQQLNQSQSTLQKSQADLEYNQKQLQRFRDLRKINAISQQQLDQQQNTTSSAESVVAQTQAAIAHDTANVRQFQEMQSWEQVVAPFDCKVTARAIDVGTLVMPGTTAMNSGGGREMFHVADTSTVRVMITVPQTFVAWMTVGQPAMVFFRDDAQHGIPGVIARFSAALDAPSRTLLTEVDVPNPTGKIVPGMYLQVNFSVSRNVPPLMVPDSAVIFNADGARVVTVKQEGDKSVAHFVQVGAGRDTGAEMEITSGLNEDDIVVTNPGERLVDGGQVKLANVSTPSPKESAGELGTPGAKPVTVPTTAPVVPVTPATQPSADAGCKAVVERASLRLSRSIDVARLG